MALTVTRHWQDNVWFDKGFVPVTVTIVDVPSLRGFPTSGNCVTLVSAGFSRLPLTWGKNAPPMVVELSSWSRIRSGGQIRSGQKVKFELKSENLHRLSWIHLSLLPDRRVKWLKVRECDGRV